MTATIERETVIEVKSVTILLHTKAQNSTKFHHEYIAMYGKYVMARKVVLCGSSMFTEECMNMLCVVHPYSSTTEDNLEFIQDLVHGDHSINFVI